ncbi:MAG: hypothetical protein WCP19_15950 [Chloroflexota bacterium]
MFTGFSKFNWNKIVITLSFLLFFVIIPHSLEDFAVGEPGKHGAPLFLLAEIIAAIIALQAFGLLELGKGSRRGFWIHLVIGFFWPAAAISAQLPVIKSGAPYRSGLISVLYIFCMILIGLLIVAASLFGLNTRTGREM